MKDIGVSPFNRFYYGTVKIVLDKDLKPTGVRMFTGKKEDITDSVFCAMYQYCINNKIAVPDFITEYLKKEGILQP